MIGGSGQELKIKNLIGKVIVREMGDNPNVMMNSSSVFTNEKRNCDCCLFC